MPPTPGAAVVKQVLDLPRVDSPVYMCHSVHDLIQGPANLFLSQASREAVLNLVDDEHFWE